MEMLKHSLESYLFILYVNSLVRLCEIPRTISYQRIKEKLTNTDRETWYNSLMSDGKDANNGNKLRIYRLYEPTFQAESYVKLNMSRDQRPVIFPLPLKRVVLPNLKHLLKTVSVNFALRHLLRMKPIFDRM